VMTFLRLFFPLTASLLVSTPVWGYLPISRTFFLEESPRMILIVDFETEK
jgi:hypothetical protein